MMSKSYQFKTSKKSKGSLVENTLKSTYWETCGRLCKKSLLGTFRLNILLRMYHGYIKMSVSTLTFLLLRFSLKLSFDEKCHDLEMAKRNLQELTIMLEEKNADTMSDQQHKLQSIAGKVIPRRLLDSHKN